MKKFFAIVITITMMLSVFTACGVGRANTLYSSDNNELMLGLFFMEEGNSENATNTNAGAGKEAVDELYKFVNSVETLEKNKLMKLENQMIEFFKVEYDVDVTDKMEGIKTSLFSVKNEEYFLMGYHIPGENEVFVNREIYLNTPELFAFTWCHEVIHLLGLDYHENRYWALYESVTEAVNIELMEWMGESVNDTSAYMRAAQVGKQLISANPELVSKSLYDDNFRLEDDINEILEDAKYTLEKIPEGTTIAFQLGAYLTCLIENNDIYWQAGEIFDFSIQEITTAYCRRFDLTDEQIEYAKSNWMLEDFDHTTIVSRNGYIELKR